MASAPLSHRKGRGLGGEGFRSRRLVIGGLLAVQALLAVIALWVWVWTPDAPPVPPIPKATAPLVGSRATLESALPLAEAQASAWLPGAVLLEATMQVDWPWTVPDAPPSTLPGTGWLSYAFLAPWQPPGRPPGAASLGIVVERLSGAIVNQDADGWEEAPEFRPPSPPSAIDATRATLLAEAAGGTAFRRACPAQRHLSRTFPIAAGRTQWPQHWVIVYEDTRVPDQHGLLLRIDASSGKVLDRESDAPDCP
jgi:hypothetical protein